MLIINNEIVKYTSVGTGNINIATNGRGLRKYSASRHDSGDVIRKYELNGISLRRINNVTHTVSSLRSRIR